LLEGCPEVDGAKVAPRGRDEHSLLRGVMIRVSVGYHMRIGNFRIRWDRCNLSMSASTVTCTRAGLFKVQGSTSIINYWDVNSLGKLLVDECTLYIRSLYL
jgi:hypothetical protein